MRTVQLEWLRPGEIRAEQQQISLVYLPVSPLEWHSYHMPMGTDALIAQAVAKRAAAITGGIVAPTLFAGTERNDARQMLTNLGVPHQPDDYIIGMDFPANTVPSMYLHEEVFAVIVREQLRLLAKMGFRMIVIVNGHGSHGQLDTLRRVCDEVSQEHSVYCVFPEPSEQSSLTHQVVVREHLDPGHADRTETAMMMALTDGVALEELPPREIPLHSGDFGIASGTQFSGTAPTDGVVPDDPRDATAAVGEALLAANAQDIATYVLDLYRAEVHEN